MVTISQLEVIAKISGLDQAKTLSLANGTARSIRSDLRFVSRATNARDQGLIVNPPVNV